jgi:dipeptidyl-peptidase-4
LASAQKVITNELIWASQEFAAESFYGFNSMSDGLHYTAAERSDALGTKIVKYRFSDGLEAGIIASSKDVFNDPMKMIEGYSFSADETKILIETEVEPIYRYSYFARYSVHDLATGKTFPLASETLDKQRLATFSPGGKHVAFIRNNNLFITELATQKETQITFDGAKNMIINGASDWVYEEELELVQGYQWSPDGSRIAYYRFDESNVKEFSMDIFGELYPHQERFKYPKAGEQNSIVNIYVYDITTREIRAVDTGADKDIYLPRIYWTKSNDGLCIMRMNRHQNKMELLLTDYTHATPFSIPVTPLYTEVSDTYIDVAGDITFMEDGSFICLSERDGYRHLWWFNNDGSVRRQITKGNWDIIDYYGFDATDFTAYYTSSAAGATEKDVFASQIKKGKTIMEKLSTSKGYSDAYFSNGFKYYIITYSNAGSPPVVSLYNRAGKEIRVLKDNAALKQRLTDYSLVPKEFFSIQNSKGDTLNCWMMKPGNFSPEKKYPVLVAIYGGPGSNTVNNRWEGRGYMWHQMLCQKGYVVVSCDPRGTQYRGRKFKHLTYMNLGKLETEDFIDLAKYLGNQAYIDKSRMGIQGWSFGGYMTSLCMTKGADYYKAGIAVAPVTNWKYYDSIYTERFMRTPAENSGGYENNSPINFVEALRGKFLLIHGSADDNVHFQNTMDMTTALVSANKPFEMFVYPNKNHGISGGKTRLHLYEKMTHFLMQNL